MKKNILGAIVIFFVTFTCLLALSEITNKASDTYESQNFYAEE